MKKIIKYDKNALGELNKFSLNVRKDFLGLINNLEESGKLDFPDAKKISRNIFEIRVTRGGAFRSFYAYIYENFVIILHFFRKKTQKTPVRNLKLAERRLRKYV